jgi:hypothetical protein
MMMLSVLVVLGMSQASMAWVEVSSDEYLQLSAAEKNELIFSNCLEDTTAADWIPALEMVGMFLESMCPTIRAQGDELPYEDTLTHHGTRRKYIHTVGTVAQVEWQNLGGHSFTGLFQGASQGIVRMSLANQPDPAELNTAPGIGLKFLRDSMDSANLVAMYGVDGQESWNFFKNDFTNHIPAGGAALLPLSLKFAEATMYIQQVALSDWANYDEAGTPVDSPVFPYSLRFHPTGDIQFSDTYVRPHTEDLVTIPNGSTLYEVYAMDQPEELGGTEVHIADLVMTSDMITSLWGDQHLFFRHQDMMDDIDLIPEWKEYTESFGFEHETGCPVKKIMEMRGL